MSSNFIANESNSVTVVTLLIFLAMSYQFSSHNSVAYGPFEIVNFQSNNNLIITKKSHVITYQGAI